MLEHLELLMLKPSSYWWPSVRAFHLHPAKQTELCCLEWTSTQEIHDRSVMFFKHSDLKLSQTKTSSGATSANLQSWYFQPRSPSTTKPEMKKDCHQWNYYDSCLCYKLNSHASNAHHKCRMCTKGQAPYAALPKEEKSNPAFKHTIYVTTMRVTRIRTAYFPFDQGLTQWYMHLAFKSKTVCAGYLHHSTYFSLSAGSAWCFWCKNSSSYISDHWGVAHLIKRLSRWPHHWIFTLWLADWLHSGHFTWIILIQSSFGYHFSWSRWSCYFNWISTRQKKKKKKKKTSA